ncbi:diguanylate cyclase domain-containing protein [Clostridium uliginosum]|uniref:PAS domain S-box-containing protein/diguanylate cyclase (GGDEF) domain-containing protein n=1 Tax=Clostridium uliginosum TaxID=119641 RepID=A0A1I1MKI8_9CLOT|nr:diguanylate cyclase [Clostridium uliginosum]SFC85606.1 PAS domain S-box-containing protein/diguanylate cyclase (GGDEF) domain-containing protein [Clostridium uliginosum]
MNIRKKFITLLILLATIPVIISTSICLGSFNNKYIKMIEQNVIAEAKNQSTNLENFFGQCVINLNVIINMPASIELLADSNNKVNSEDTKYNMKIVNQILTTSKNEQSFINIMSLINKNGIIIASSGNEYIGKDTILSNQDIEKLSHNQTIVTKIISREDFNNGVKSCIIATPIFCEEKYQGSVLSIIDMSYFEKIVNDKVFFKTGKITVMDGNGDVAATVNENLTDNINNIEKPNTLSQQWNKIDFNNNQKGTIDYTMDGIHKIGYYSKIADTGWTVLSVVEWDEFTIPLKQSIKVIFISIVFILVLIIIANTFIINYFSKPVYKLLESIKRVQQGNYAKRFIYNKANEFGEIAIAFNELIDTIVQNESEIEHSNRKLKSLVSNIPGGVHRSRIENGCYILDFMSAGSLNVLGYNKEEIKTKFDNQLINIVYEKDRDKVSTEIMKQLNEDDKFNIEYRVVHKDGSIIWVLDNGQIVENKSGPIFTYSVVIDITESKTAQEKLRLSENRHRIIMEQTEDIIFEWTIAEDTISYSSNWNSKFKYIPFKSNVKENVFKSNSIYKDDAEGFKELLLDIEKGNPYRETEIRIRTEKDNYIWCRVRVTAIFDENGFVFKAIGVIIDIDKEKRKTENLLFKAQRDSLTELYNKGTVQQIIENYIDNDGINGKHALFMIDIDDFKSINDNLGHLFGDSVLHEVSLAISNVFTKDDVVGRVGGDEFMVFLKNVDSEELILKKADDLVQAFKKIFTGENLKYKVSGSVGIARYPYDGENFNELFINADKALYSAKNQGKDNYCIFSNTL